MIKKNYSNSAFKYRPNNKPSIQKFRLNKAEKEPLGILFYLALTTLITSSFLLWHHNFASSENTKEILNLNQQPLIAKALIDNNPKEIKTDYIISKGDIPAKILTEQGGLTVNEIDSLLETSKEIHDLSKLQTDRSLEFTFDSDTKKCQKIVYYPNNEKMIIAERNQLNKDFIVTLQNIPYEISQSITTIEIDEFLYKDGLDAGLTPSTIIKIADIFSFDIDFTTEIRQGDKLKLIYEKRTLDGKPGSDGKILAAKFTNEGQEYYAYYFESENNEGSHYDQNGKELLRQFLRAPLSYSRITSGYTGARLHPITKKISPHYQIDYAAPIGTPVIATAKGTVSRSGWENGWGHIIRLSHNNGYTTHYAHLSAYAKGIKTGSIISQGQVIGYVGSTGWSTGPHLDYGMKFNGNPVNPLSLKLPKGKQLEGGLLKKFQSEKEIFEQLLVR